MFIIPAFSFGALQPVMASQRVYCNLFAGQDRKPSAADFKFLQRLQQAREGT
jgi:hypothetical protein